MEGKKLDLQALSNMLVHIPSAPMMDNPQRHGMQTDEGRVFQAISGNDEWHERKTSQKNMLAITADAKALYKVAYKQVVYRDSPNLAGRVMGAKKCGQLVQAVARCDVWVKVLHKDYKNNIVEAWMMVEHPTFGVLLEFLSGSKELPVEYLSLQSSSDVNAGNETDKQDDSKALYYKVIHGPSIMVRNQPSMNGKIVKSLKLGVTVRCLNKTKDWLQIEGSTDTPYWILSHHPELGKFVERV